MKRWPVVILVVMAVLGAVVPGCRHVPQYYSRLTAADSLMRTNPDSALALLEALTPSPAWGEVARSDGGGEATLTTEADRAYYDLLLTQARYKAYITATSDSDINRALAYYRAHPTDREKLTRALIYKGAVMEELGHPDSAMLYYKTAEATAAPDDYFNLGYTKMRMGTLYRDYYSMDGKPLELYEEALPLFIKCNNLDYEYICLNHIGCSYRESDPLKAEGLLRRALSISLHKKDTVNYLEDLHALTVLYYYNKDYTKALDLIHTASFLNKSKMSFSFCTTAANVYAKMGLPDSALSFLKLASQLDYLDNDEYKMYFLESEAEIKLAQGDTLNYMRLTQQESRISDSLIMNTQKPAITKIENTFYKVNMEATNKRLSKAMNVILVAIFMTIILALGIIAYNRRANAYRLIINELRKESGKQLKNLDELQKKFDSLQIQDNNIRQFIATQLDMLRGITANCYHAPNNKLNEEIKKTIAFQDENKHMWLLIYDYIDAEYNNIISDTHKKFPGLNDKEVLLLALSCMNFSYIRITRILGCPNPTRVRTLKTRLAETIGYPINDYISFFNHH